MNYYRRYSGDYLRDTASLSLCEHGVYCLLLDYAYATERPIPADRDEVMRLLRAFSSEERKAVVKVLERYWVLESDGYHNSRVDDELGKAVKLIEKQKANGALGGRPKKTQTETQEQSQTETQTITQNNQPPSSNHQPPAFNLQPPEKTKTRATRKKRELAPVPENWFPKPETMQRLAAEFKFSNGDGERYVEAFRDICASKGHEYANIDAGFANCVRQDWPKFRNGAPTMPNRSAYGSGNGVAV